MVILTLNGGNIHHRSIVHKLWPTGQIWPATSRQVAC